MLSYKYIVGGDMYAYKDSVEYSYRSGLSHDSRVLRPVNKRVYKKQNITNKSKKNKSKSKKKKGRR